MCILACGDKWNIFQTLPYTSHCCILLIFGPLQVLFVCLFSRKTGSFAFWSCVSLCAAINETFSRCCLILHIAAFCQYLVQCKFNGEWSNGNGVHNGVISVGQWICHQTRFNQNTFLYFCVSLLLCCRLLQEGIATSYWSIAYSLSWHIRTS